MALMNAVIFPEFGPPTVFKPTQIERPEPVHGEALVKSIPPVSATTISCREPAVFRAMSRVRCSGMKSLERW